MSTRPRVSVIIPARNAPDQLRQTLPSLLASDLPRDLWELIIVDDASTDDTATVAAQYADLVVRLPNKPSGPGYARNRGAEVSRGEILVFVDADVRVYPTSLRQFVEELDADPGVAAVFGSYDDKPPAPGFVSQYRNLLHHHVHQRNAGEAETFWAGLGAIRRSAFREVGMFDEWHYHRPQIEDIELGRRMRGLGYRILLNPGILATHLKRWSLWNVIVTDFRHRGVPWMWLLLKEGRGGRRRTLNLRPVEWWCTGLIGVALMSVMLAAVLARPEPLVLTAIAVAGVLWLSRRFYGFLARRKGAAFALAAVPLHIMYYVSNGFSVLSGWTVHFLFGEPQVSAHVDALAQLGVKTWPPVPARPRKGIWSRLDV